MMGNIVMVLVLFLLFPVVPVEPEMRGDYADASYQTLSRVSSFQTMVLATSISTAVLSSEQVVTMAGAASETVDLGNHSTF